MWMDCSMSPAQFYRHESAAVGKNIEPGSVGGFRAWQGWGVYSGTKFAVEGLSEAMHAELLPLGIHVTIIEPEPSAPIFSTLARWAGQAGDWRL